VQTVHTITNDATNWCLGLPTQTTVTSTLPDLTSQTRTVSNGTPDYVLCRLTQEVVEPASSTLRVTTSYGFDSCGNVNSVTIVGKKPDGTDMDSRQTQSNFGTACLFPESITNALNQTSSATYNLDLGLPATQTDPNNLTVSFQYDNFGRPTLVTRPDGTSTATSYAICTSSCDSRVKMVAQVDERDTLGAVIRTAKRQFDILDREIYAYDQSLSGSYTVRTNYFNALGQPWKQYLPIFDGMGWGGYTEHVYDMVGRTTRVQLRNSSGSLDRETVVSYEGRKIVTTDPKGNATQRFVDIRGMLRRLTDPSPGGTTNYAFDHFGNLKSVTDAASNVTSADYNLSGHRTSTTDPDLGTWSYVSNSLGELVTQTDAKSQVTTVVYDLLGRPTSRAETEGTSNWVWGTSAANKNIGKLASLSGPGGYAESYAFDSFGRPSSTTITSDTSYQIDVSYHSLTGLPETMTYPTSTSGYRFKTKFEYSYGILKRIKDFSSPYTTFWELNAQDERGMLIDEQLGNGARIITGFDSLTGLMMYRQAGTAAPYTNRQNLSFEWDLNGNLKKRIDLNQSNLTEEFFYDALNRLDYSQLNGVTNLDLTLDAIGNITAKTSSTDPAENVGSYTYHATKKHAVVSTSNGWSFGYDANGNMTSYKGNSITWTSYNLPSSIAAAGQSSQFWYGPNRNRWKQLASYPSGTETTIYVGGILEKVTVPTGTGYRHYVGAGSAQVVYTRWSTGSENTRYLTADHLNSSSVLMDASGNTLVGMSFAAYGRRRGATWTGAPSSGDWTQINNATRHGYTGHEHLDNVNLIHMNGRVFEPVLGRFLSADPFMPGSLGSQAGNRYAYVGNRPLSLTDPSGFWPRNGNAMKQWKDKFGADTIAPWEEAAMMRAQTAWHQTYRGFMSGGVPMMQSMSGREWADTFILAGFRGATGGSILTSTSNFRDVTYSVGIDCAGAVGILCQDQSDYWSYDRISDDAVVISFWTPGQNSLAWIAGAGSLPQSGGGTSTSTSNASQPGRPHQYAVARSTVCTADEAFGHLTEPGMSAPGAPAATEGFTPNIKLIGHNNNISQLVDVRARTITNETLPGHEFYKGQVVLGVFPQPNDHSLLQITGTGTNERPRINNFAGKLIFGSIARELSWRCKTDHGIPGSRSPGEY
jgi:RHS repeat-associated protein